VAAFDRVLMLYRLDNYRAGSAYSQLALATVRSEQMIARAEHRQELRTAKGEMEKAELMLRTAPLRSASSSFPFPIGFRRSKGRISSATRPGKIR
jgi:hypothetical protein